MPRTRLHQSSAMGLAINVVAVILALVASATSTVPAQFPHGKTIVYKYYGDVKAGIIEPAPYASQFALEGLLNVKHETSDPTLTNAYYVSLTNVKTGMHNGVAAHYQRTKVLTPITEAARIIQEPFLIVYDESSKLQGVKINDNEPGWSKNMKMAIASMLQLDLASMKMEMPVMPQSFTTKENTIHGDCWITYDVHDKNRHGASTNELVITKFSSPKNCSGHDVRSFDHVDEETCQAKKEEPVNVASRRVFEIEKQGENIIIKKLVAHGGTNYFPWNARSEAHYVLTNTTLTLERVVPVSDIDLPTINFENMPMTRDLTYLKPRTTYATNSAIDVTQGRRVVDQTSLVPKLKKMLGEAADYIEESHLEMREPDWKHGQTINRILQTMSYMTVDSLEKVYNSYRELDTPRDVTIKNVFLGMIPQIGTPAGCHFALSVIRQRKIADITAIEMLAKLPLNVKVTTEEFLLEMEDLVKLTDSISIEVRKAGILCFSTMIYRTMKNTPNKTLLDRYLEHFFERFKNESKYEMQVVYLMAMRNVKFGKIYEMLGPIIRGDLRITENSTNIRLLAIWSIEKSIESDYHYAQDLLWPIMADTTLPIKLRIAAYEILMTQAPSMTDVLRLYWFMVYEKNEHLYNYHYTTLKGIANSVDPCRRNIRENARKIMRFTRVHDEVSYKLSGAYTIDYEDEKYNHGQKLVTGVVVNEESGAPEVLHFEHIITDGTKRSSNIAVRIHVEGCDDIVTLMKHGKFSMAGDGVTDRNAMEVLKQAAHNFPKTKYIHVDVVIAHRGRIIVANHYNERTLKNIYDDVARYIDEHRSQLKDRLSVNYQNVIYENLYEKQVTSDMGLAVLLENRVPLLSSLKINYNTVAGSKPMTMNLEIEAKLWRHGDYSMSIYNPMADVWHSIRRSTATDVNLPIRATIAYNSQTNNLKMTVPRLPATKLSAGGIFTHAKDCVTVNEDDTEALKRSCPTCHIQETVTRGIAEKKYHRINYQSKDTGLEYSMALFDCENGATPVTMADDWYRAFTSEMKNDWNDWLVRGVMATHRQLKNTLVSPRMGSCGSLAKIEPSIVHPTSHVDINIRGSFEDVDHTNPSFHLFATEKYNLRGTLDVIAASTNASSRSWDMNVNVDVNQDHLMNIAKIQLTRKTPGEKNFKICIDGQKSYSAVPMDPLKLGITKEETNTKITIAAGPNDDDKCSRDDTLVTMTIRGELSDEQKKKFNQDIATGGCTVDMEKPFYKNPKNILPKTLNCLNDAIRYTTLRKYTINVAHKKVPHEITSKIQQLDDILRTYLLPNMKYTLEHVETGNIKVNLQCPMQKNEIDVSVATPGRSYDLLDVNFEKPLYEGFGPVIRPLWYFPLDNTRFSIPYLYKYTHGTMKMCSIYPEMVLTGHGKNIPFVLPDQWTLISGQHYDKTFAIVAKPIGTNMGVKIFVKNHAVEILPKANNDVRAIVDGENLEVLENGVLLPSDPKSWIIKLTKNNDHVIVQMKEVPIMIFYGINHVALAIDTQLQGKISGLCGHLDGINHVDETIRTYGITEAPIL